MGRKKSKPAGDKPERQLRLTEKQQKFCIEYLKDFDATKAYVRAGFTNKYPQTNTTRLFKLPHVQAEIKRLQGDVASRHLDIIDKNIRELALIAYGTIDDVLDMSTGRPVLKVGYNGRLIESISEKQYGLAVKTHDKLHAIDILNKMVGAYTERVDITSKGQEIKGTDTPRIVFNVLPDPKEEKNGDDNPEVQG